MTTVLHAGLEELVARAEAEGRTLVVGAGIQHAGRLLLVRRATTENFLAEYWEVPGGKVDQDESILDALVREVREETALEIRDIRDCVGMFDYDLPEGLFCQFTFLVDVTHPHLTLNPAEHDARRWIHPSERPTLDTLRLTPQMRAMLAVLFHRMEGQATSISA